MTSDLAIEIHGLRKAYGTTRALDGLELAVPRGALAGFVGLNGAGKTTTLRILLQMARADAGTARVLGYDAGGRLDSVEIRRRAAFVPERKDLFPYMRTGEVVEFTKSFYPTWRGDLEAQYREEFGLDYGKRVTQLSKGTLTKLQLLLALSRGAELILLDEPTDGLDPLGTDVVMRALAGYVAQEGVTLLFSSHRLNEIEQIADHLCMIHEGRSLLNGPVDDLKEACQRVVMVFQQDAAEAAREFAGMGRVRSDGRTLSVLSQQGPEPILSRARNLGARPVEVQQLTIKELFLELVKGDAK
jgi:ABC-2 type transport system ATP-binding protein